MDFVDRLKALREDHDLTQKDVAIILNKSQQGYAHLENRKAKFTVDDVIKLCLYYNVSADYILGLTDTTTPKQKIKNQVTISGGKNKLTLK